MTELLELALVCLRIGTFVFGGGFVFIPMMRADVVDRYHWLTEAEFTDAVGLGQMTPGPVLVTATFIGYKVAGLPGAIVATVCIFLPSFLMVLIAAKNLQRLQGNRHVKSFLWGVRAAVVGLVVAAALTMARTSCADIGPAAMGMAALALLLWKQLDAGLVIVLSGIVGLALWGT